MFLDCTENVDNLLSANVPSDECVSCYSMYCTEHSAECTLLYFMACTLLYKV